MNTEELTQIVTGHQNAISRHDQEMAEIRATLQQSANRHQQHEQWQAEHQASIEATQRLLQLNQEQLNTLTAGLLELRHMVADYLQGRSRE
jgi:chromosome segregation ATPase